MPVLGKQARVPESVMIQDEQSTITTSRLWYPM